MRTKGKRRQKQNLPHDAACSDCAFRKRASEDLSNQLGRVPSHVYGRTNLRMPKGGIV